MKDRRLACLMTVLPREIYPNDDLDDLYTVVPVSEETATFSSAIKRDVSLMETANGNKVKVIVGFISLRYLVSFQDSLIA